MESNRAVHLNPLLLIDGDEVVYKAAHASQNVVYDVYKEGDIVETFKYKKDATLFCNNPFSSKEGYYIEKRIEPKEEWVAYANTRTIIRDIVQGMNATNYSIYLSGPTNFRTEYATITEYKGNRDPDARPFYYKQIKEYLINEELAIVTSHQEADDALGIMQYFYRDQNKYDPVIVSQDKDLRMIEGYYYDTDANKLNYISKEEGDRWFFIQLLAGDTTDCIPGIHRVGYTTAERILVPYRTNEELFLEVTRQYEVAKEKGNLRFKTEKSIPEIILELGRLLWIRRKPDQIWEPELLWN